MSTQYNTVAGIVQFPPQERVTNNGQAVRDVLIQAVGSGGKNVKITIWPENEDTPISKGDFLAVSGKWSQEMVNGKEYLNISASQLVVVPGPDTPTAEKEVTNKLEDETEEPLF